MGRGLLKGKIGTVSLEILALSLLAAPAFAETAVSDSAVADSQGSKQNEVQQNSPDARDIADAHDIIVTARRRSETSLQTPVVLSAYSGEQLARFNVTNLVDVAKLTPQLSIGAANGSYGGILALRGVSSPTSNPGAEGAVTINIDGVPVSYGSVLRISAFDIGQVEILKGPQALFFGKNSSGGIISIRSAEPTDVFKAQISGAYEFNARQVDLEGYVSGPVTDTLNMRLAGRFSRQRGYFRNTDPDPSSRYAPGTDEEATRLSLNWQPDDQLTVKLRGTYHHVHENGGYGTNQKVGCPAGVPAGTASLPGIGDCEADNRISLARIPSALARAATGNPRWDSDTSYYKATQFLVSGDVEYKINDFVTLNSVTGFYSIRQSALDSTSSGRPFFLGDQGRFKKHTFSEELRLTYNSPDSPINLMLGGFYQDDSLNFEQQVVRNAGTRAAPVIVPLTPVWYFPIEGKTYSVFGQMGWDIIDAVSLSAGVRYSQDKKSQDITPPNGLPNKFTRPSRTFSNWSPELTLAYKPSPFFNLFGSYKEGFKAGSYNISATAFNAPLANPAVTSIDNSYAPEKAKGFEIGLKTLLLDRQLRVNLAAYSYLYKDLQLSRLDPIAVTLSILNASSARIKGLEGDFTFSPNALPGLSLTGSVAYNSARYASSFFGPCYTGQTIAAGCVGAGNTQQFLGRPLPRAPKFSGSVGMSYEMPIADDWNATFNANGVYTSSQYVSQELSPIGITPKRFLLDSSLTFASKSKSMEFAIIGRNLTNKQFLNVGFQSPGTGGGTGTTVGTLADYEGSVSRGREIWLRITLRPSEF